jgi:hypothetical protein
VAAWRRLLLLEHCGKAGGERWQADSGRHGRQGRHSRLHGRYLGQRHRRRRRGGARVACSIDATAP